jgi:hypothetical protein
MWVGGQRHAPAALLLGKSPGTHCIEGWVSPFDGLDGSGKSRLDRDSIPGPCRYTDYSQYIYICIIINNTLCVVTTPTCFDAPSSSS